MPDTLWASRGIVFGDAELPSALGLAGMIRRVSGKKSVRAVLFSGPGFKFLLTFQYPVPSTVVAAAVVDVF
jgi:hypothetical protein